MSSLLNIWGKTQLNAKFSQIFCSGIIQKHNIIIFSIIYWLYYRFTFWGNIGD